MENIQETKQKKCYKRNCLQKILSLGDFIDTRKEFWERDRKEQGQFLLHFFSFAQKIVNGKQCLQYNANGKKEVCQKAWIQSGIVLREVNLFYCFFHSYVTPQKSKTLKIDLRRRFHPHPLTKTKPDPSLKDGSEIVSYL